MDIYQNTSKQCQFNNGRGFIGFSLAQDAASKGKIVYLVDNFTRGQRDDDFEIYAHSHSGMLDGDLLDQDFCQKLPFEKVETLYHFAAINGTQNFLRQTLRSHKSKLHNSHQCLGNPRELQFKVYI